MNVTATATDDEGITQVEFSVDGSSIGVDTNGGNGWSLPWDTTTHPGGPATVSATATDTAQDRHRPGLGHGRQRLPGDRPDGRGRPELPDRRGAAVRTRLRTRVHGHRDRRQRRGAPPMRTAPRSCSSPRPCERTRARSFVTWPNRVDGQALPVRRHADDRHGRRRRLRQRLLGLVQITDAAHPLAAGLSGTVTVTTANHTKSFGVPGPAADVVATATGGRPPSSTRPATPSSAARGRGLPTHLIGVPERTGELHGRRLDAVRCRRRLRGVELPGRSLALTRSRGLAGPPSRSPACLRPLDQDLGTCLWARGPRGNWTIPSAKMPPPEARCVALFRLQQAC